ncbi:hypothetical protein CspHIS471_0100290 [Cutaneotrichosporon sp. HIS471]|nr:hypothetical protein CspHIS471_0100290 [Cutaneotrichosporon sp. HIS471]
MAIPPNLTSMPDHQRLNFTPATPDASSYPDPSSDLNFGLFWFTFEHAWKAVAGTMPSGETFNRHDILANPTHNAHKFFLHSLASIIANLNHLGRLEWGRCFEAMVHHYMYFCGKAKPIAPFEPEIAAFYVALGYNAYNVRINNMNASVPTYRLVPLWMVALDTIDKYHALLAEEPTAAETESSKKSVT